jgi:phage terminase large subunit-like protein
VTPSWATSCPDWKERIVAGRSLIPFDPLFPAEAAAASAIFDDLVLKDVAGKPTIGQASRPWFRDFARSIFGSYNPETGERLIQNYFLCISKKNAKSTLAAGVMLTALLRNWRESGEFYILAPTLEVANNSYFPLRDFLKEDAELSDILHAQDHLKTITHRTTGAFLKVVASDSETVSGKKGIGVFVDELWQFGKKANAGPMLIEATGGLVSRPEGFVVYATTHSDEPPTGIFKEKLEYFRGVRDGAIHDPSSLPVIYEWPEDMRERKDYLDPKWWFVTNPNLGASVSEKWIAAKLAEYQNVGEHAVRDFVAKHLNVEIGQNLRGNRWPGADYWAGSEDETVTLDSLLDRCEVVVVGYDGGGLDDLSGLFVLGRERSEDRQSARWLGWAHAWCHEKVLERRKSIASKLRDFEKEDSLTIVGDDLSDIAQIIDIIRDIKDRGLLAKVMVDAAGLGEFVDALASIGVTQDAGNLDPAPQGWGLMNAIKTTERRLAKGMMIHARSLLMDWCVTNLKIEPTATGIRAAKQTAGDAKIDPAIAMFNAVVFMSLNPEPSFDFSTMVF